MVFDPFDDATFEQTHRVGRIDEGDRDITGGELGDVLLVQGGVFDVAVPSLLPCSGEFLGFDRQLLHRFRIDTACQFLCVDRERRTVDVGGKKIGVMA